MQLAGLAADAISGFDNIVKAEINRLLNRAKSKHLAEAELEKMQRQVFALWRASGAGDLEVRPVQNFIHALSIADFLTRKTAHNQ